MRSQDNGKLKLQSQPGLCSDTMSQKAKKSGSEMAQLVKVLTTMPGDLSVVPGTPSFQKLSS